MTLLERINGGAARWRGLRPAKRLPLLGSVVARCVVLILIAALAIPAIAQVAAETPATVAAQAPAEHHGGGEANLQLPDLESAKFLGGIGGHTLLTIGLLVPLLGLVFGLLTYTQLRNLPVHSSMREISELIYETCKTYLITQGKFLLILEIFIGVDYRLLLRLSCSGMERVQGRSSFWSSASSASPAATAWRGSASA